MRRCNLLLLLMFALTGCADEAPPKIGVIVSETPAQAADIAAAELRPGERGYFEALIAVPATPATDAEQAIEQAYAFVNDPRVLAVVGHANSASSLAASQIYNEAGLVQIAPTTTAPVYGAAGPFSFRLVPSDSFQAQYLSMVLEHHFPDSRIALVHVNDDYGRGLVRMLRPQLDNIAFEGMYADGGDSVMVTRLRDGIAASKPDLLVWLGRPRMLGLLLPQLRRILPDLAVVCADACDTAIVYDNADGEYTGLFFVRFLEPGDTDSATVSFRSRYQKQTGQVASGEALLTYDAVRLVRAALLDGARTREEVRQYLVSLGSGRPAFEGITGKLEFDGSGASTRRPYRLAEVRADGVAPAEHAMGRYEH